MLKKIFAALLVLPLALFSLSTSPQTMTTGEGFTASCSQSASFIARATGIATYPTYENAVDAFICGMQADGNWSTLMDAVYIFVAPTQSLANLNLAQNCCTAAATTGNTAMIYWDSASGYTGWTKGGSSYSGVATGSGYIDTNFNLVSSGAYYGKSSNNYDGSIGVCDTASRQRVFNGSIFGASGSSGNYTFLNPNYTVGEALFAINSSSFRQHTTMGSLGTTFGMWVINRSGPAGANVQIYNNGAEITSTGATGSNAAPYDGNLFVMAGNTPNGAGSYTNETAAYLFVGGPVTSSQVAAIRARFQRLLTSMNAAGCG